MPKEKTLAPVRPNEGLEAAYRKRLEDLIAEMNASVLYWIKAGYRQNTPEMAELASDASPAKALQGIIARLTKRWQDRFDDEAQANAEWFANSTQDRSDRAFLHNLRKEGLSVKFKMTRAMNDVSQAAVAENVSLIKSIPAQYFTAIQGSVMRAVSAGCDLGALTNELEKTYGVTHRRAAFLAKDQGNKLNADFSRARELELGIVHAKWLHSKGGKHPRPSHVAASGQRYEIAKGCLIDGEYILPGQLPGCHCVHKVILPALDTGD